MATTGSISSSGQFINIDQLVQNAVRVQQTRLDSMQSKQSKIDTTISTLGKVKSQISSLFDKFQAINTASSTYAISGTQTGLSNVSATANGNYSVAVNKLASGQISTSGSLGTSNTQALGFSGTIKVDLGAYDGSDNFTTSETGQGTEIEIKSTDTLKDIQDKLNASGQVNASLISGKDGYHLSFSSKGTGEDQGFKISVTDSNNTGLNALSFQQGQSNSYIQSVKAQDAEATVNGVTLTSKDNTFTGVQGFKFTATQTSTDQNITAQQDNTAVTKAITDFVTAYNTTTQNLKSSGANVNNQFASFGSQLRNAFNSSDFSNNLSQIGLTFDKAGALTFDSTKLTSYANSGKSVTSLLNTQFSGTSKGAELFHKELDTGGVIDGQTKSLTDQSNKLDKNIESAQDVLSQQQLQYRNQYAKLDAMLSSLNDNSSTVTQLMNQFNNNND